VIDKRLATQIRLSKARRKPDAIDLGKFPATKTVDLKSAGILILIVDLALAAGLVAFAILDQRATLPLLVLMSAVLAGMVFLAFAFLSYRIVITIDGETVQYRRQGLFGRKEWAEPLKNYRGVAATERFYPASRNSPAYTEFKVVLVHPDGKKCIDLFIARNQPSGQRAYAEKAAKALTMPALEADGDGFVERAAEDVGRPVEELAREGKIDVSFDADAAPRKHFRVDVRGDRLVLSPKRMHMATLAAVVGLLFIGIQLIVAAFIFATQVAPGRGQDAPTGVCIAFGVIGVLTFLLGLIGIAARKKMRFELAVSPEEVSTAIVFFSKRFAEKKVLVDKVTEVTVSPGPHEQVPKSFMKTVLVVSPNRTLAFHTGKRREEAEWVKSCILSVIAAQAGRGAQQSTEFPP